MHIVNPGGESWWVQVRDQTCGSQGWNLLDPSVGFKCFIFVDPHGGSWWIEVVDMADPVGLFLWIRVVDHCGPMRWILMNSHGGFLLFNVLGPFRCQ